VGRENRARGNGFDGRGKVLPLLHDQTCALQHQKGSVSLVDVPDRRLHTERFERPNAGNTQNDLLLDARLAVAAVELMRNETVILGVMLEIGVEQHELDVPDAGQPYLDLHVAARNLDRDVQLTSVGRARRAHRQFGEIGIVIGGLLVASLSIVCVYPAVEQTDPNETQTGIGSGFAVIAGGCRAGPSRSAGFRGNRTRRKSRRRGMGRGSRRCCGASPV
jgi:hypothetical protein